MILRLLRARSSPRRPIGTNWSRRRAPAAVFDAVPGGGVASAVTPSGGGLAGKYDLGMLCVAAGENAGFNALDVNWGIANEIAAEHGRQMDPGRLRLVVNMHLAETREQAMEQARFGLQDQIDYLNNNMPRIFIPDGVDSVDWFVEQGNAVIAPPDDAMRASSGCMRKPASSARCCWARTTGPPGKTPGLLRAVRTLRNPALQEVQPATAELLSMGDQTPGRAHRKAQERRAGHVRQARGRMVAARRAGGTSGEGPGVHLRLRLASRLNWPARRRPAGRLRSERLAPGPGRGLRPPGCGILILRPEPAGQRLLQSVRKERHAP